jgi:hypothetical protein
VSRWRGARRREQPRSYSSPVGRLSHVRPTSGRSTLCDAMGWACALRRGFLEAPPARFAGHGIWLYASAIAAFVEGHIDAGELNRKGKAGSLHLPGKMNLAAAAAFDRPYGFHGALAFQGSGTDQFGIQTARPPVNAGQMAIVAPALRQKGAITVDLSLRHTYQIGVFPLAKGRAGARRHSHSRRKRRLLPGHLRAVLIKSGLNVLPIGQGCEGKQTANRGSENSRQSHASLL